MANLNITEFVGVHAFHAGVTQQAASGPLASQVVAIGATDTASAAFNSNASLIRVHAEADCTICIGESPDSEDGILITLDAGQFDYFHVLPGWSLAVIERTVA